MTISIDGTDIGQAIEIAGIVGSIVALIVAGFIIYLMVRPPRRSRKRRAERDEEALATEEMLRLMDRMEQRLAILERAVDGEANARHYLEREREQQLLDAGDEDPQARRTK